jgi:Holliday junction resolvasome RuvABC endonuclease subunit
MSLILGIDVSYRRTGLVLHDTSLKRLTHQAVVEVPKKTPFTSLSLAAHQYLRAEFTRALALWPEPTQVVIEQTAQYGTYRTALVVQQGRAALYAALVDLYGPVLAGGDLDVLEITPQEWKLALTGRNNADKTLTLSTCQRDPRLHALTQGVQHDPDLLDAALLTVYPATFRGKVGTK